MGFRAFFAIPFAIVPFFFSGWILMIFAGILEDDLGITSIGYGTSLVATIGLWLVVAPLAGAVAGGGRWKKRWRYYEG